MSSDGQQVYIPLSCFLTGKFLTMRNYALLSELHFFYAGIFAFLL